jgi:hypothetical protein
VIGNGATNGYDITAVGRLRLRGVRCGRSAKLRYPPRPNPGDETPIVVGSFGCVND